MCDLKNYVEELISNMPNKIRKLRKLKGYRQSYVAKEMGVSAALISCYERGIRIPSVSCIIKLSYVLDVNIGSLFSY